MDKYKCTAPVGPREVDLDDLTIYPDCLLEMTAVELHQYCWKIMGKSLFYMQYFHPDMRYESQYERVDKMCKEYAEGWRKLEDTPKNRLWYMKLIYRFEDEVENQC